uniref:Uncharacterized protein n=1 Tax=Arundo donax TaxID=35708 RepID=A0A0A8YSV5_ARUDO
MHAVRNEGCIVAYLLQVGLGGSLSRFYFLKKGSVVALIKESILGCSM